MLPSSIPATEDSDSDDGDYAPRAEDDLSSSESEAGPNEESLAPIMSPTEDPEEKKRKRDSLWADFQASVASASTKPPEQPRPTKRVKIEKKYRFAGEETTEVVEVDEDSSDAKQWPLWADPNITLPPSSKLGHATVEMNPDESTSMKATLIPSLAVPTAEHTPTATTPAKPAKKPGPRKPKTTLASLPGSTKAKKLTTLDKSAMDWQAHIQSEQATGSSIQDELQANRRGGGYLEKVEFLKRVEGRKEENLDALKNTKRRKL